MADITSNPTVENMSERAQDVTHDVGDRIRSSAANVAQGVKDASSQAMDMARQGYSQVRDQAADYFDQGRQRLQQMGQSVQGQIYEHPINAVLIAAGVGFLLGLMLARRS